MKCILKGLSQTDPYSGEMKPFETEYAGIPEACAMWASGYKHCFLEDCSLFYSDTGKEVPDRITDKYYDRYYYGRYNFDENGEEVGTTRWTFLHLSLYFPTTEYMSPQVTGKRTGVLIKK
jgi:hypothetical protein